MVRARLLPVVTAITTSMLSERVDHAFTVDGDWQVSHQWAVGISLGHGRWSQGYSDDRGMLRLDFRQEWLFGIQTTFYLRSGYEGWFGRGHFYLMLCNQERGLAGYAEDFENLAWAGWGSRMGFEAGYLWRFTGSWVIEATGGLSAYLQNPYQPFEGPTKYGVPSELTNWFWGLSDVYPTFNFALGRSF